jgi:hypothetical protein
VSLPPHLSLTTIASMAYEHVLMKIAGDVFLNDSVLGYELKTCLVNSVAYSL